MTAPARPPFTHTGRRLGDLASMESWGSGERSLQFGPGGDPELGEDAIQMRADGAVGQIKSLADLAVAQAFGGHLGDLQFLRGELIARLGGPWPTLFPGGTQLLPRTFGPRDHAESVESLTGGAHGRACSNVLPLLVEPLAVGKLRAGP